MTNQLILIILAATAGAAMLGFIIAHSIGRARNKALVEKLNETNEQRTELQQQVAQLQSEFNALNDTERSTVLELTRVTTERDALVQQQQHAQQNSVEQKGLEHDLRAQLAQASLSSEKNSGRVTELQTNLSKLEERCAEYARTSESLQNENTALKQLNAELRTSQDEKEQKFAELKQQIQDDEKRLQNEFENIANKIFDAKGKSFSEQSQESITNLLKPFKEQMEGFRGRIDQVHTESVKSSTFLQSEIKKVLDVGLKMSDDASNLTKALKGDKKAQGNWGEVQAEMLLQMAGFEKGREYDREANFKTEEGKDQRPDFVVNLPQEKHIIIDSKISLNAYVLATAAESEEEQQAHLTAHAGAIRTHVKSLSDKNYPNLKNINSPEFVFMFIGNEPAYLAAFNHDPNLFQDAYRKGIAIVTPNTLLSSLRIVSHLWSIDRQNSYTRELADQATKVYDKLRIFVGKMEKLGLQLNTVQKTYDDSWNTLKDGKGSLSKQVAKFVEMGVTVKEKLPLSVTEATDIERLLEPEQPGGLLENSASDDTSE